MHEKNLMNTVQITPTALSEAKKLLPWKKSFNVYDLHEQLTNRVERTNPPACALISTGAIAGNIVNHTPLFEVHSKRFQCS
jgi:NADPH-dependent 7-cyano-7-deazaguanine reductase QueF